MCILSLHTIAPVDGVIASRFGYYCRSGVTVTNDND